MIVFDTNVISEMMKKDCAEPVVRWLQRQDTSVFATTSVTAAELLGGAAILDDGARKRSYVRDIEAMLEEVFAGRVLPFDEGSAANFAAITGDMKKRGRAISFADCQIAAICKQHGLVIVTRDSTPFKDAGLSVINPWADD